MQRKFYPAKSIHFKQGIVRDSDERQFTAYYRANLKPGQLCKPLVTLYILESVLMIDKNDPNLDIVYIYVPEISKTERWPMYSVYRELKITFVVV